ncbi:MAG: SDR family NAD(P)-dependent oxidoreductase [Microthrixaceae bacterium]|jgi:cyclic-di-GMP-binding biofilm dispersal mediator protein
MSAAPGRVVAVVGASGVLGDQVARQLLELGDHVVATSRDTTRLQPLVDLAPGRCTPCRVDLRNPAAGDELLDVVRSGPGRLDAVVLASGVVAFGDLVDTPDDVIEELFVTNVVGPLWLLRRLVPELAERRGVVVSISAVVAERPLPGMAAYSASKAALSSADEALRRELRRRGIRVVDARPPHTETGLVHRALSGSPPTLPQGARPVDVAQRIVEVLDDPDITALAAEDFDRT